MRLNPFRAVRPRLRRRRHPVHERLHVGREKARQLSHRVVHAPARRVAVDRPRHAQFVPGAREGDVQEPPLLLQILGAPRGAGERERAVGRADHEHRVPLLPLGRVHGAEHEHVVLAARGRAGGEVLRAPWRLERERGEERPA